MGLLDAKTYDWSDTLMAAAKVTPRHAARPCAAPAR
jgi:hypothetical protein